MKHPTHKQINFDIYFGHELVRGGTLQHGRALELRRDEGHPACIPSLPMERFGLIAYDFSRGEYILQFDANMTGEVLHLGKLTSLVDLCEQHIAVLHRSQELWCYALKEHQRGKVVFGEWMIKFCFYREEDSPRIALTQNPARLAGFFDFEVTNCDLKSLEIGILAKIRVIGSHKL